MSERKANKEPVQQGRSAQNERRANDQQTPQQGAVGRIENRSRPDLWTRDRSSLARRYGSPFRFSEEVDRLFDDMLEFAGMGRRFFEPFGRGGSLERESGRFGSGMWSPEIDIFEREGKIVVRADLPGLTKDDITLDLTDDSLIIRGERRQEHEENDEGVYRSERRYGSFYRSIPISNDIDAEDVEATFKDGVLEIKMPAPQREQRGRRIEIGGSENKGRAEAKTTGK